MQWTEEMQLRFNELRQKELAGTLSINEKDELAKLFAVLEADEKQYLAGAIVQIQAEQRVTEVKAQVNRQLRQHTVELETEIVRLRALIHQLINQKVNVSSLA